MKILKQTLFFAFCGLALTARSQNGDAVLMTIDGDPVPASEFEQVYLKNIDLITDDSQKDIDGYLELFKHYKLKVAEAKELGYQDRPDLKRELRGYRDQLADSYMSNAPVTEALIEEAYDHLVNEVRASHIMIALPSNASPEDTLNAWATIDSLRNRLLGGVDFDKLARANSDDPSVRKNGGDLGWFKAFRMVYPFEKAAYDTPVGEMSPIIRTRYGYHILKTTDKRKSQGEVEVAHIMITPDPQDTSADPEARIRDIYKKLKQGEPFDVLAQRYSDDDKTAKQGGRVGRFGFGSLSSPIFERHAFALKKPDALSEPFKSELGWHIIKLIQKYPVQPLEEVRPYLKNKIKSDSRSQIVDAALQEKLEKNYQTTADTLRAKEYYSEDNAGLDENAALYTIEDDTLTLADLEKYERLQPKQPQKDWRALFKAFQGSALKNYYKDHLAETNREYAGIVNEYREGILLFALMEDKVWNAAKEDSVGLRKYFDDHRKEYARPMRYDVDVATTKDPAFAKTVRTMLLSGKEAAVIKDSLNTDGKVHVFFTKTQISPGAPLLPKGYRATKRVSKIYNSGREQTIVVLNGTEKGGQADLADVKGKVISDYQQYLEEEWLKELTKKHTISIDLSVLANIKKELSQ